MQAAIGKHLIVPVQPSSAYLFSFSIAGFLAYRLLGVRLRSVRPVVQDA